MRGRILKGVGGFYEVLCDGRTYFCRARGRFRKEKVTPMIGDWVRFTPNDGEELGSVDAIEPRTNALKRPPMANVDALLLVTAASAPPPDLLLMDKLLLQARLIDVSVEIVINKCDLAGDAEIDALVGQYADAVSAVHRVSAATGTGLDGLQAAIAGRCCCLAGQSGVGKSSLLNALFPSLSLETGSVSQRLERGRHTTRHVELLMLDGAWSDAAHPARPSDPGAIADTPGFSLLEMEPLEPRLLPALYPEFAPYENKCRFAGCLHQSEPGCAVKDAVADGSIPRGRWERYTEILTELKERWKNRYD
jgi:ribosome biogenesis GTPase